MRQVEKHKIHVQYVYMGWGKKERGARGEAIRKAIPVVYPIEKDPVKLRRQG